MKTEIINPNVKNFIKSLRDIGYSLSIAVADIIDNSITANAKEIHIQAYHEPELSLSILDDGYGMTEFELVEAMRLSSKDPDEERDEKDLGKFGLGLKTASFSQCKKLTVISKKNNLISIREWNLDYISEKNQWLLITPDIEKFNNSSHLKKLESLESGTIVMWEKIDRYQKDNYIDLMDDLNKHLSLVFHQFLEENSIKIYINNKELNPFNPFNKYHPATQQIPGETILFHNEPIKIQPYILPHHSKMSQEDYEYYATEEGYIKAQGFYLYRAKRLLVYGTWWGLHKSNDAHKLVRIKIDISNSQDKYWGIDVKKSTAHPDYMIKNNLKRIISIITPKSSRVYKGRAKLIDDKHVEKFWDIIPVNNDFRFGINKNNPLLKKLKEELCEESIKLLNFYLNSLEMYLPLLTIQAYLQENPLKIKQETALNDSEIVEMIKILRSKNISEETIELLIKTEVFKNKKEYFYEKK